MLECKIRLFFLLQWLRKLTFIYISRECTFLHKEKINPGLVLQVCCLSYSKVGSEGSQVESAKLIQDQLGQFNEINSLIFIYIFIYCLQWWCMCHRECVKIRGPPVCKNSLLLCGFWRLNQSSWVWWQSLLPTVTSCLSSN